MNILVTGARGFVGRNLVSQLRNIQLGKARCYGEVVVDVVILIRTQPCLMFFVENVILCLTLRE